MANAAKFLGTKADGMIELCLTGSAIADAVLATGSTGNSASPVKIDRKHLDNTFASSFLDGTKVLGRASVQPTSASGNVVANGTPGRLPIPHDATIPQSDEGVLWAGGTVVYTPKQVGSTLVVEGMLWVTADSGTTPRAVVVAIFKDSETDARGAISDTAYYTEMVAVSVTAEYVTTSLTPITWKLRWGPTANGTLWYNHNSLNVIFDGIGRSFLRVTEYSPATPFISSVGFVAPGCFASDVFDDDEIDGAMVAIEGTNAFKRHTSTD